MARKPLRAVLACAVAAALSAFALASSAQANTTLPGLNGKLAYTTNADIYTQIGSATAAPRLVKCPLFAPLGDFAGFGFDVLACTAEIATVNPDGTGFTQVTNNQYPDDMPAWLPADGSKIAYQGTLRDNDCEKIFCGYNLYDTNPDGTNSDHPLTTTDTSFSTDSPGTFNASHPSYSPDGSTIAFEAFNKQIELAPALRDLPEDAVFKQFNHIFQTIYKIPAGGESVGPATPLIPTDDYNGSALISDSQPAYSPDGTKIAFVRLSIAPSQADASRGFLGNVTSSIYVMPASGGEPVPVESTPSCDITPQMAARMLTQIRTGAALPQGRGTAGPVCIWDAAPAWSPDGSKIAVERVTFPTFFLTLNSPNRSAQTRGLAQVFEDSDIVVFNSADGSGEVDLSKVTEPSDCGSPDTLDSGFTCGLEQKPAWSPDGTKIAFFSNRDASGLWPVEDCFNSEGTGPTCDDEIWTMSADGTSPFQVTNNDVNDINPDWQRIPPPPVVPPVTPPVTPAAVPPKVGVAGVRRACVSKAFHVRFHIATTASSVKRVVVKLDGKRIKSTTRGSFTLTINSKKLRSGRHRLTITATDSNGRVTTTHKSFSVCKAAKPRRKAAPRFTG